MNTVNDIEFGTLRTDTESSDSENCRTRVFILNVSDGLLNEEQVLDLMHKKGLEINGSHCQHDYDCCGQWYANKPRVIRLNLKACTVMYIVIQKWYRNL